MENQPSQGRSVEVEIDESRVWELYASDVVIGNELPMCQDRSVFSRIGCQVWLVDAPPLRHALQELLHHHPA